MPSVGVILNGISRKKKKFYADIYPILRERLDVTIFETEFAGHAIALTADAVTKKFDFIIAAGGDGTLHQVVNGILRVAPEQRPPLGLIPLGTGNDFARTCSLNSHAEALIARIEKNAPKKMDVGCLTCNDNQGSPTTRYFINACSLGMGPAVVLRPENSSRMWGPFLTYWKAIMMTFFTHRPMQVYCTTPQWRWEGKSRVLAIANGKSFGNSIFIAPDAQPDDGMLNCFIAGDVPLFKFLVFQSALKSKKKINDPLIKYNICNEVSLTSPATCPIETEGELAGYLPATIKIVPSAIDFLL